MFKSPLIKKIALWIVPPFLKFFSYLLLCTCSWKVKGLNGFLKQGKEKGTLVALWHSSLFITPFFFLKYANSLNFKAFISKSQDGELLSKIVESYPNASSIRVSHQHRGVALKEMIEVLKRENTVVLITPDGPRGPPKKAKEGVYLAAKKGDATLFTLSFSVSSYFELSTWDKMIIPKPFSKITATFSPPKQGSDPELSLEVIEKSLLE